MSIDTNFAETIAALGAQAMGIQFPAAGGTPFVVVPEGCSVEGLEKHLPQPTRKRGSAQLRDLASFLTYVERHLDTDTTTMWHTVEPPRFHAVFNDDAGTGGAPGWSDHSARYDCPLAVEWKTWTGSNKKQMTQADFAQFIEDNLPDVVCPDGATMLEISRTLSAKKAVNFKAGVRLDNGENQLTYEETIDGSAGAKGQFKVPEVIQLGLPVFEGGDRYAVNARLRYRIGDQGKLVMWYDLERPHKVIEDAVRLLADAVKARIPLPLLNGSPT